MYICIYIHIHGGQVGGHPGTEQLRKYMGNVYELYIYMYIYIYIYGIYMEYIFHI